ncbi:MAG TPA: hypothetical protein VES67_19625 [Vicinamibacterales bacterium]|nr:hypothetical protein [Vicinamibacterales bacterium]
MLVNSLRNDADNLDDTIVINHIEVPVLARFEDLDVEVLEALIAGSVAEVKRRYPSTGDA